LFTQGLPTEVPATTNALLWALILAAVSAIVYLYKKREDDRSKYIDLLKEMLTVTGTVTVALDNVISVMERLEEKIGSDEQQNIVRAIEKLGEEWKKGQS